MSNKDKVHPGCFVTIGIIMGLFIIASYITQNPDEVLIPPYPPLPPGYDPKTMSKIIKDTIPDDPDIMRKIRNMKRNDRKYDRMEEIIQQKVEEEISNR